MKLKQIENWKSVRLNDRTILAVDLQYMSADQRNALGELEVIESGRKGAYKLAEAVTNLEKIRTSAGISQGKLADISGVSVRMIQFWEQGSKDINKAQGDNLYKLARALNVQIESILETERI